MEYPAKTAYQSRIEAVTYESSRFSSLKGKLADYLEKKTIGKLLGELPVGSLILDVACGTGRITRFLCDIGFQAWGVDISKEMLAVARQKLAGQNGSAKFYQGEAENLPFAPRQFEAVTAIKLMGHVPPEERIKILKELKRVSRTGIVVSYYFSSPVHQAKRSIKRFLKKNHSPWYPVTPRELTNEVESAGLRILKQIPVAPLISETRILLLG